MMGSRLMPEEVKQRLADAKEHDYNPAELGDIWGVQDKTAAGWMRENCRSEYFKALYMRRIKPVYNDKRDKPEWENQWVNDLQVLTQEEYMMKYRLSRNAYAIKLCRARKEYGEIYTPKQRAKWDKEYWRAM